MDMFQTKSDCNNYFKTAEQRKSLGVADAKGIINYYKFSAKTSKVIFRQFQARHILLTRKEIK